ncbi:hypothetical protein HQ545_02885 [Candidatus Woesearchaeota archaeon]|nr:hypothetical protein [Candidatus Woesearchaeota archaeon]
MSDDRKFWENLEINYKGFKEDWNNEQLNLQKYLNKLDIAFLIELCDIIGMSYGTLGTQEKKKELVKKIIGLKSALELCCLYKFYRGKINIVRERCQNASMKLLYTQLPFLGLVKLFYEDPDNLSEIRIDYHWRINSSRGLRFRASIPLKEEFFSNFDKKMRSIAGKLTKKTRKGFKHKYLGSVKRGNKLFCLMFRQTADKIIRNIDRNKRNKTASDMLVMLDFDNDALEIRCKNDTEINRTKLFMENAFRIYFAAPRIDEEMIFDSTRVQTSMRGDVSTASTGLNLIGAEFNRSQLQGNVPLSVPYNFSNRDVSRAISQLEEMHIVNLDNISYINSFSFVFENKLMIVTVKTSKEDVCFTLEKGGHDDDYVRRFSDVFEEFSGYKLNHHIKLCESEVDKESLMNTIFMSDRLDNPHDIEIEMVDKLKKIDVIKAKEVQKAQCTHCKKRSAYYDNNPCPHCGDQLRPYRNYYEVDINEKGIKEFLSGLLAKEGIELINPAASRKVGRRTFSLMEVEIEHRKAFILICLKPLSAEIASYFKCSAMPLLIVNVGVTLAEGLIDMNYLSQISLSQLILNVENAVKVDLKGKLKEIVQESNSTIVSRAKDSEKGMSKGIRSPGNYSPRLFEHDSYNIIKLALRNAEKWGVEMSFVALPEGISSIDYSDKRGKIKNPFVWDCKLAKKEKPYNLNMDEKRKVCDYIRKMKKHPSLTAFGQELKYFVLVSNNISDTQMKNAAVEIKKSVRWKGHLVLLEAKSLILLYKSLDKHYVVVRNKLDNFFKDLHGLFNSKNEDGYVRIVPEHVRNLFAKYE